MNAFSEAMDGFYQAFADFTRPRKINTCPCCLDKEQAASLLATPLRQIAPDDLTRYASSALLTVGDVSDYLYFLPRIMEVTILDGWWRPSIEVTARAIHSTDLQSWPKPRRAALCLLLETVIDEMIASDGDLNLEGWLCAIAGLGFDVAPFLAKIEKNPATVLQLFEDNVECLKANKLSNGFWNLPNVGHDVIVQWFKSNAIRKIPFEAYDYQM